MNVNNCFLLPTLAKVAHVRVRYRHTLQMLCSRCLRVLCVFKTLNCSFMVKLTISLTSMVKPGLCWGVVPLVSSRILS